MNWDFLNNVFTYFVGIIAFVTFVLYFFKPMFCVCVVSVSSCKIKKQLNTDLCEIVKIEELKVIVKNKNLFRNRIIDIRCEATMSTNLQFNGFVNTLSAVKNEIICLNSSPAEYTFCFKNSFSEEKKYLRIRLLANNIIGVKKVKECFFEISTSDQQKVSISEIKKPK